MKSAIKLMLILSIATICYGFAFAHYQHYQANKPVIESKMFVERVHSGDTVDSILEQYYSENEDVTFNEFKYNILHLPENRHLLNQYGGLKLLDVGDKIVIIAKVRIQK